MFRPSSVLRLLLFFASRSRVGPSTAFLLPEVSFWQFFFPSAASSRLLRVDAKIPANLINLATIIPPQHKRKGRIFHSQQQNEHIVLLQPTPNSHPRPFGSSGRHNCRIAFFVRRWSSRCVLVRPTLDTAVSQIISHCSARLLGRWRRSATSSHVDPRRSASPRSNVQQ